MDRSLFHKKYGLTVEQKVSVTAEEGFSFKEFDEKHGLLFAMNLGHHTFPLEEDFAGNIQLVLLNFPAKEEVDTAIFTHEAKSAGYFFVGLKGIMLACTQAGKEFNMFMPKLNMVIPHREVMGNDYVRSYETNIPILCFDGMIKYSSTVVHSLPRRNKSYGILLGRKK